MKTFGVVSKLQGMLFGEVGSENKAGNARRRLRVFWGVAQYLYSSESQSLSVLRANSSGIRSWGTKMALPLIEIQVYSK